MLQTLWREADRRRPYAFAARHHCGVERQAVAGRQRDQPRLRRNAFLSRNRRRQGDGAQGAAAGRSSMGEPVRKWLIGLAVACRARCGFRRRARSRRCSPATRRSASRSRGRSAPSPARRRDSVAPRDATLTLAGTAEAHPIRLSARGITRRLKQICDFPPLRVEFAQPPAATSLFAGQRRLKLVTHCQSSAGYPAASAARIFRLSPLQSA